MVGCFGWQALVSAQLLVYGQNEDPGPDLADLYWKTYAAKNHSQEQPSNFGWSHPSAWLSTAGILLALPRLLGKRLACRFRLTRRCVGQVLPEQ